MRWYILTVFVCCSLRASPVEVVLTFDDFPMQSSKFFTKKERAQLYSHTLSELGVRGVFFCIGEQMEGGEGLECARLLDNSHILAHHSFHHTHLSKQSLRAFHQELKRADALFAQFPNYRKWYRFPYLDLGNRKDVGGGRFKSWAAFRMLRFLGYRYGYVTINTFDWYVNGQLYKAVRAGKKVDLERLKKAYLVLLDEWIDAHHEARPCENHPHVLLLHQNDLNALFLKEIVTSIRERGWEIVDPERAFDSRHGRFSSASKGLLCETPPSLSEEHIDAVLECFAPF